MPHEDARPAGNGTGQESITRATASTPPRISDQADLWQDVRAGWRAAGQSMPRAGSLAFRALPEEDPVRAAVAALGDLDVDVGIEVRRHGPAVAKALAAMRDEVNAA
ncbi:hypothetical protein [Allosalinactinospora lopnorensis]|uniref:hypothetical protein n=1 Tax=Allosalinactinospora lopnorensis TaxID=1352348 RepID=UPI0012E28916|nr:hypothetical protein [Allosalinactinospora lopnorensis]